MYSIRLIRHSLITSNEIDQVIALKQVAWSYPKESQLKWIRDNLMHEDIHVFLCDDGEAVAYLNLVQIQIQINNNTYNGFGIGNVCAKSKGNGYGSQLIKLTNDYLKENNKIGLLFCHTPLIKFYSNCNWNLLPSEKCLTPVLDEHIHAMIFNSPITINSLIYKGRFF